MILLDGMREASCWILFSNMNAFKNGYIANGKNIIYTCRASYSELMQRYIIPFCPEAVGDLGL